MSSPTTFGGIEPFDATERAALQKERMIALTDLLYLLLAGPMVAFGIAFLIILKDPWLGCEVAAGLGELVALALSRRGHYTAARLLGCALVALIYVDLVIALGPHVGIEIWGIPMIAFPPLLTLPGERALLRAIYALFAVAMIFAHTMLFLQPPRIAVSAEFALRLSTLNLLLAMGFVGSMIIFYYIRISQAEAALGHEHERAERLLANILPAAIAARLKREEHPIADHFDEVSVLFADVVGFTPYAASHTPAAVVNLLNTLFYAFDDMVARRGLEKIKTVGDAYMVASGVPTRRADHAVAIADLAIEMIALSKTLSRAPQDLALRIGIHSGPVIAGVIGKHKFSYDLWGGTVNMASRLQSTSEPGRIHISDETARRLGPDHAMEERGAVALRGIGTVTTYFLVPRSLLPE
jgi:class 3 adenylate cyclase